MELKGKKVLVVGLGKSGLAAALFLRRRGAQVTVSDLRSAEALSKEIPSLLEAGIMVEAGGHGLLTFRRQDLIVVTPGVPLDTPELVQVRNLGLPIIGELELAARFLKGRCAGHHRLQRQDHHHHAVRRDLLAPAGCKTLVAGNIGVPVIELVDQSTADTWSVLEVSSFQLETTESFHPRIAVILNITPDHLDRHGTFENYVAMKEKIFANQTAEDYLILNADDPVVQQAASRAKSQVFWFSRSKIVRRGAFLMNGMVMFRASEQGSADTGRSLWPRFRSRASTMSRMCWLRFARPAWRRYPPRSLPARSQHSRPSSIGSNSSPPSTASTTTTTPRPPTSTPRPRRSPPSREIFT